jgi:pimeloyl-ACP methyl ester carboxylesterase
MTALPLVLLHAFPADSRLFDGLRPRLGASLVTPDLPGFGAEPLPVPVPDELSVPWLTGWVIDRLASLGAAAVVLGGCAIGGYLAIEVAARRPDLVRGLVVIGCKPAADDPALADAREAVARLALDAGSGAVADRLTDRPLAPGASDAVREALHRMIGSADPRGIAGLVRGLAGRPDPVPSLRAIRVPALVLCGSLDPFTRPEQARAVAALLPGSTYVEVPDTGHLPPLERPDLVLDALVPFLASIGRDAAA